jgi:16S rRNA (uracil1498-N3)-methyltransferase
MDLFYHNIISGSNAIAEFDDFERQHIVNTYRKKLGDIILFTDGAGCLFKGNIIKIKPKLIVEYTLIEKHTTPKIVYSLGIGFIRPARLDFIIEKGTELGILKFYLFSSKYSNYFTENIARWQKIARQAIKQSLRYFLPEIIIFKNFSLYLEKIAKIKYKFFTEQDASSFIFNIIQSIKPENGDELLFTVGPEGGFTENELQLAKKSKFYFVSLGKNRLRTETAAIAAASYMNLLNNNG